MPFWLKWCKVRTLWNYLFATSLELCTSFVQDVSVLLTALYEFASTKYKLRTWACRQQATGYKQLQLVIINRLNTPTWRALHQ